MAKCDNKPVLIVKNMYEVLCRIHAEIDNYAGQKQLWESVKQNWSFARPLTSKRAIEVAAFLFDLFFFIGSPPTILQFDNGKEFCTEIIKELVGLWPSVKIINGRSRHLQSQGLVERGNGILQQKLGKWRETSGRKDWSYGLRLVILSMNNSICRSHKKTPYELVYGDKPRGNCSLIDELFARGIYDEENISEMIKIADFESSDENLDNDFDFNENLLDSPASSHMVSQNQDKAVYFETRENETSEQLIPIDPVLIDITNEASSQERVTNHKILREAAWRDLENYTEKMVNQINKGKKRPNNYEVEDLVRISVPKIDRFGTDRPMLPCKILEKINN
ncbi:unnamed protein product [Rhizophagus irregularis]|nr:unnamed protein product [Rhizophagus irregularis]